MRKVERGFGTVEILLIVVTIGLIVAVGWLFFDRQNSDTNSSDTQQAAQDNVSETRESEDTKPDDSNEYLAIKEWGIRFKIPDSLRDSEIIYKVFSYPGENDVNSHLGMITRRAEAVLEGCKNPAGGIENFSVIIHRSTDKAQVAGSTDGPVLLSEASVSGYYYARSGWLPTKACPVDQLEIQQAEIQRADADALAAMLHDIEASSD